MGRKLEPGVNDLATVNPELASEWDYEANKGLRNKKGEDISTPDKVKAGANYKVWWECKKGHKWDTMILDRSKGSGCPYCAGQLPIYNETDLQTLHPELALEWHPTKNIGLKDGKGRDISTPSEVLPNSGQKVWWECSICKQTWDAAISDRVRGNGCPYCAGKLPILHVTDLKKTHPEIADLWHPTKNGNLKPTNVKAGSKKEVWWQCERGHEWDACVYSVVKAKNPCPYCAGRLPIPNETDLATVNPTLAKEWDYEANKGLKDGNGRDVSTPDKVSANSNQKVSWLCDKGHKWKADIYARNSGHECPFCNSCKHMSFPEQVIYYYIKENFPDVLIENKTALSGKELDIYIPSIKTGIEYDGYFFHQDIKKDMAKNKLAFEKGIRLIRIREEGCPLLEDYLAECIIRENNTSNKSLEQVVISLLKKLNISQSNIDIVKDFPNIASQVNVVKTGKSLKQTHPDIAAEWHPDKNGNLTPDIITHSYKQPVWWKCKNGHEWNCSPKGRCRFNSKCPLCAGKLPILNVTDLQKTHPLLAEEWHPDKNGDLNPCDVKAGSNKKVWWKCRTCGHEWLATPNARTRLNPSGCPNCYNSRRKKNLLKPIIDEMQIEF